MASRKEGGNREFLEFLKDAPTLEEASSGATQELTGLVSRTEDGRFAITTGEGQTYELEVGAVQRFRPLDPGGLTPMATIQVASEALQNATLRPLKPIFKDVYKDPIKDIVHDGTLAFKDVRTDPVFDNKQIIKDPQKDLPYDTPAAKDIRTDPVFDATHYAKDVRTDPAVDKPIFKDIHKDPLADPIETGFADVAGTGPADPIGGIPDPTGQITNPAFNAFAAAGAQQAGMTPFVMATPHHAPQHLVAMQAGLPQMGAFAGGPNFKPAMDTIKEVAGGETGKQPIFDTAKEMVRDTFKEMIRDTYKEMVWDTWIEGGPFTMAEGTFDPGQIVTQPGVMQAQPYGMPGFM